MQKEITHLSARVSKQIFRREATSTPLVNIWISKTSQPSAGWLGVNEGNNNKKGNQSAGSVRSPGLVHILLMPVYYGVYTQKKHAEKRSTSSGNTHLEGNIIVLVNRGASLQHIFWRAVFSLLVRQRRLSRGHGTNQGDPEQQLLYLQDASEEEEEARGVRERSVPGCADLQPLCSHSNVQYRHFLQGGRDGRWEKRGRSHLNSV